ncbi:EthD domain-containing protein [Streptomyces sp. MA5143a]|uniref:EthD domain-containing protein n=1 Tax=Streptomyces sp. MA5143a TaxID=2083010 RepID=UPI000D1A2E84|nr:EthD domain-containing protein [Streptomyces sp. MA5143a]SPF06679.1 EthD protein [Streptomyces sp. MA5143a]
MLTLIAAIRRKPGMTHRAFLRHLHHVHGPLAAANPLRISGYVQNHVFDASFGAEGDPAYLTAFGRDSVTELRFDDMDALATTMSDPYSRDVIGPDGARFNDLPSALALLTRSEVLVPPPVSDTGTAPVKVLHFVRPAPQLRQDDVVDRWQSAHEQVIAEEGPQAKTVRGWVQHRQVPGAEGALRHFGGTETVYAGVSALYYDSEDEALAHFPSYERSLRERSDETGGFWDPSRSFALYSREVTIF